MLAYTKTRFHAIRLRLENHVPGGKLQAIVWEFSLFVFKQGWACLFAGLLLGLLVATKLWWPQNAWLARYDFLFLAAILIQMLLLVLRMETVREVKVILMFHAIGTFMELFKTRVGSWNYPEHSFFRIGLVPLFSGFMYGSVGSFLARVSRIMDMRYTRYPSGKATAALGILIYANFFAHHYFWDIRWPLFVLVVVLYGPTTVYFRPYRTWRRMPLLLGFGLVTLFIWTAENIGTFTTAWVYPNQQEGWRMVDFGKFGSWLLLMIVSFILVSLAHRPQLPPAEAMENRIAVFHRSRVACEEE